jgi:NADH:ubiquinone reductase (H+-translocating)
MNPDLDRDHERDRGKDLTATAPEPATLVPAIDSEHRRHVVIVGAGFAGLYAALGLRNRRGVRVTVIDRSNHHLFQPLLYQVATAVLNASEVAAPIRHIVRADNVTVLLDEALSVDRTRKRVICRHGEVPYDDLVLAAGATHSYFGHDEWAKLAPGLKTIEDALEMRGRILAAFEEAERELDPERRRALLTFVVVGGGPTGVELAGALAEIARHTLPGEFRNIDPRQARILLVEGNPRLLGSWPAPLSDDARETLARLGVEVRTGTFVTDIKAGGVKLGADWIAAGTTLWGAGVVASPLAASLGTSLDRAGRVKVTPELTVPGADDVYVIGDVASVQADGAETVPGVAPAAIQAGKHVARSILAKIDGRPPRRFRYRDRGMFAVIGRGAAVGVVGKRAQVNGFLAWLAWLAIHIAFLIGFRNRVLVLLEWAYSFVTMKRQARLITGESASKPPPALGSGGG